VTKHTFGGPWTEKKLRILGKYLSFYTTALRGKFRTVYIDAFAGNGHCVIQSSGATRGIPGSVTIALETTPPFDEYHLLEARADFAACLHDMRARHPDKNITIYESDANQRLPELIADNWSGRRGVLFLDPYGLELDWEIVRRIAATQALDVWFLVSLSGIYRQASREYADMDEPKKAALDRFLGTQEWRSAFYRQTDMLSVEHAGRTASWEDISKYVKDRLAAEFAGGVLDPIILRLGNTPLYGLYFALANPNEKAMKLALRVAKDISC
jgi:three-Cys-motif partner protein